MLIPVPIPLGVGHELGNKVVKIEIDEAESALVLHLEPAHGRDGFLRVPVEKEELARLRLSE